ncbi:MAG: hypothetical protein HC925_03640 [Coleofasciculaceae cyanobacterium SM2_3_26]|nr:hypothetical protein [Coleofasciculaceae cyanobacterium SM2_3_26]
MLYPTLHQICPRLPPESERFWSQVHALSQDEELPGWLTDMPAGTVQEEVAEPLPEESPEARPGAMTRTASSSSLDWEACEIVIDPEVLTGEEWCLRSRLRLNPLRLWNRCPPSPPRSCSCPRWN